MRGEHAAEASSVSAIAGSSPRARGTRDEDRRDRDRARFIPACAGNTSAALASRAMSTVHPRVRGEHLITTTLALNVSGSSPRARGTLVDNPNHSNTFRFIPACAGNTICGSPASSGATVHPRVRGEHIISCSRVTSTAGSSPRARGTPRPRRDDPPGTRFIPACAGNTAVSRRRSLPAAVHPRVRGEHSRKARSHSAAGGSSPRARGTP